REDTERCHETARANEHDSHPANVCREAHQPAISLWSALVVFFNFSTTIAAMITAQSNQRTWACTTRATAKTTSPTGRANERTFVMDFRIQCKTVCLSAARSTPTLW